MELTLSVVTALSVLLTGGVISNAFIQKTQFYPSVVFLTKSNASMAVIYLQGLVAVVLLGKILRRVFFGQLRPAETEHLVERSWHAVIETCLAFTVFRDDFSPRFVAMFTLLLFLKCFHWLGEDRVDYMERSPVITLSFHIRMLALVGILSAVDSYFVSHAYFTTLLRGASVHLVFGFEYAILMTVVFMISIKYILHSIDLRSPHPWEQKAVYLLYAELVLSFVKVVLYAIFMAVMMKLHTFPLFTIRPMYLTIRSLKKALNDVVKSRRAIFMMNTFYPDATAEDLAAGDNVCIICREEMTQNAKKLPCNHIFHAACLRSWFQRQQTCPTCRLEILTMATPNAARGAPPPHAAPQAAAPPRGAPVAPPFAGAVPPQPAPPGGQPQPDLRNNPFSFPHAVFAGQQQPQPAAGAPHAQAANNNIFNNLFGPSHFPNVQQSQSVNIGFPPFAPNFFPAMPFLLPFPTPPNFAGMSDQEVRQMEGVERQAVEARIRCLRNIQTLLDAATVQLQQYLSIMTALSAHGTPVFETGSATNNDVGSGAASDEQAGTSSEDPLNEVRQRRLQHFESQTSQNN